MTVAERLQRLLAKYDVSVNSVAEMAGMERMQVYRIVQGKTPNPGILTVIRIVEAAGGTMRELFEDEAED
jgi:transcriptional regulator with XRE-family HTH domain